MGRSIIAEESLEGYLATLYTKEKWLIGIIIGQVTTQKDYVIHLATTPKSDASAEAATTPTKSKSRVGNSLDTVQESWIITHARQLLRMLPGGLNVIGVFGMAPPDMMTAAQAKLRQILFAVCGASDDSPGVSTGPLDRILLQICPKSRKLTCRTFDVSDPKSSGRPADWKFQRFSDRWHRLETSMAIDCVLPVPVTSLSQTLEDQILRGTKPLCDNIWNSVVTLDHRILSGDKLLNPNQPTKERKGKKHAQEDVAGNIYPVELLVKKAAVDGKNIPTPRITACGAKLRVRGTMCCRAFVHSKATQTEAEQAIKMDILRSLCSRCQLLCEDLLQAEEDQDPKVLYETPLRIFAPLPESSVQLSDYMFQDETNNDVVDRFKELLDLTIPEDTLDTECERIPDEADLQKPQDTIEDVDDGRETSASRSSTNLVMVLSIIAVILAILVAFLFTREINK